MDVVQQLFHWKMTLEILSGSLVCRSCLARRRSVDAKKKVLHAEGSSLRVVSHILIWRVI